MLTLTEIQEIPGQETRQSGKETIFKVCPLCGHENFKFYVNSEHLVYDCKVCAESGKISKKLNKEVNPTKYHEKLMAGEDGVLDYLAVDRHLTEYTIKHFQLGSHNGNLFIPFFRKGKCVYWKLRILNPSEGESKYKNAASPVQLFNQDVISSGIDTLFIVEGEIDAMSLHQLGYLNVVAVPGANTKKNEWLKLIDESTVTKVYLIYDNDAVGQKAAHAMAEKIGIQKCWNVVLDTDKDINELLAHENAFEIIKKAIEEAEQFKLDGVKNLDDATEMLIAKLSNSSSSFKYTPSWWPSLARKMGGYEPGDLIGLMAEAKAGKSSTAMNWLYQHAKTYQEPVAMFCLEMPPDRLQRKLVSYVAQASDDPNNSEITVEKVKEARELMDADGVSKDDFIFIETPKDITTIFQKIKDVVRVYGIKLLVFDNLHLLTRNVENATAEINVLSKKFKALSMELGIPIILILQPHRVPDGKVISARNAMGSSGIEKDVDVMICIHRKRILSGLTDDDLENMPDLNTEAVFEPTMYVNVDLSRYSAGGMCKLYIDGARSTIKEIPYESPEPIKFTTKLEEV